MILMIMMMIMLSCLIFVSIKQACRFIFQKLDSEALRLAITKEIMDYHQPQASLLEYALRPVPRDELEQSLRPVPRDELEQSLRPVPRDELEQSLRSVPRHELEQSGIFQSPSLSNIPDSSTDGAILESSTMLTSAMISVFDVASVNDELSVETKHCCTDSVDMMSATPRQNGFTDTDAVMLSAKVVGDNDDGVTTEDYGQKTDDNCQCERDVVQSIQVQSSDQGSVTDVKTIIRDALQNLRWRKQQIGASIICTSMFISRDFAHVHLLRSIS